MWFYPQNPASVRHGEYSVSSIAYVLLNVRTFRESPRVPRTRTIQAVDPESDATACTFDTNLHGLIVYVRVVYRDKDLTWPVWG